MPLLSLYVHFPYCVRKCPYCDFASQAATTIPEERYVAALLGELGHWRRQLAQDDRPLHSVFLGGGTPSLFSEKVIETLLMGIKTVWSLDEGCEITLEANPESVRADRLQGYRQGGVNRLSLGVQAMEAGRLALLGRPHDLATGLQAVTTAKQAGFVNINLDLIYATPGHTLPMWAQELQDAFALQVPHLSCYALTLEAGTPFHRRYSQGPLTMLDDDSELALFGHTRNWLAAMGMPAYEISNFSLPGFGCRHNSNYWDFGDYLGIGAGAYGKLTSPQGETRHTANGTDPENYMANWSAQATTERLTPGEAAAEWLIMGLRTSQGIDPNRYVDYAGLSIWRQRGREVEHFLKSGLLHWKEDRLAFTEAGVRVANMVLTKLI